MTTSTAPTIRRIVTIATLLGFVLASGLVNAPVANAELGRAERRLARLVNNYRDSHNVRRLNINGDLSKLAERNSARMARTGVIQHTDMDRVPCNGRKAEVAGAGDGVGGAFQNLRNSSQHREIMLRSYWRKMGVGVRRSDNGLTYVTVIFCD